MKRAALLVLALAAGTVGAARAQETGTVRTFSFCTIENGEMRVTQRQVDTAIGDTTVRSHAWGPTPGFAAGAAWYINSEPVTLGQVRHVKSGLPQVKGPGEVVRTGEYRGVPVFTEPGSRAPRSIYLPLRPGCEFQRYEPEIPLRGVRG